MMNATAVNTIAKEVTVSSKALMTGVESEARLVPSDKKGIRFHLGDKYIEAHVDNVVSTEHCTVLGNQDIKVMLVEHFMAACALCYIEAVDVYLSHYELPILDGGRIVIVVIETLTGKKMSEKVQNFVMMLGLALILGIFLFATVNDIGRLLGF